MVLIVGKTGCGRWGSYFAHSPFVRFSKFVHTYDKKDETARTVKAAKGIFISPELKRDLLEELMKSRRPMEHRIDGLPGPGDWNYEVTVRHMFEEFKIRQNIKE
jgi:hypothetical protein